MTDFIVDSLRQIRVRRIERATNNSFVKNSFCMKLEVVTAIECQHGTSFANCQSKDFPIRNRQTAQTAF